MYVIDFVISLLVDKTPKVLMTLSTCRSLILLCHLYFSQSMDMVPGCTFTPEGLKDFDTITVNSYGCVLDKALILDDTYCVNCCGMYVHVFPLLFVDKPQRSQ